MEPDRFNSAGAEPRHVEERRIALELVNACVVAGSVDPGDDAIDLAERYLAFLLGVTDEGSGVPIEVDVTFGPMKNYGPEVKIGPFISNMRNVGR